jgi:hypothetical protein
MDFQSTGFWEASTPEQRKRRCTLIEFYMMNPSHVSCYSEMLNGVSVQAYQNQFNKLYLQTCKKSGIYLLQRMISGMSKALLLLQL